jgi:hypothetical protein
MNVAQQVACWKIEPQFFIKQLCLLQHNHLHKPHKITHPTQTRIVSQCGLAIYIKNYLKEELRKLKYFTMQKYNLQKILPKKPKPFKIL